MAITHTLLASNGVDLASNAILSSNTASISVTAGDLIAIWVHGNWWDAGSGVPTAITGPGGITFTKRTETASIDTYSHLSLWTAVAGSTGSGVCTLTIPSGGWDGYTYVICRMNGVKTTGTNGANAIKQNVVGVGSAPRSA